VPVSLAIVVIGAAMIVYTTRGGVSAVIWTDVVQMFVYVAGALVVFVALLQQIDGGWATVVAAGEAAGKFGVFDLGTEPRRVYTLWAGLFGGVALTLATHGTDQFLVQRLLSARSARAAASGLVLSGVIVFLQFTLFLVIGVMLFAYYQQSPLPRPLATNDEVLPLFVVTSLSHGAAGFIVAAIVAAALSPSINALAATTVNDFYLKYVTPDADQARLMRVSRAATIFWGVAQIGVALGAQWIRSVLDTGLAVLSLSAGPVLGAFLVGVLTKRVGSRAMVAGMLTGIAVLIWVWWTAATAWTWYALVGSSVTFVTAVAASFVLREHATSTPEVA
jgi:Na+/proline symporter